MASSADGSKWVVVASPRVREPIYTSADGGGTWLPTSAPLSFWDSVASSADGSNLVAVPYGGFIFTSTNSGADWVSNSAPNASWTSVASSTDGTRLVAVNNSPGTIYVSTNGGALWTQATNAPGPGTVWLSVASSADGSRLVAGQSRAASGRIYVSTDGGVTWNPATNAPVLTWQALASSADGSILEALASNISGLLFCYRSTDFGQTWATNGLPVDTSWFSLAGSADGARLIVVGGKRGIYTSTNYGATWQTNNAPTVGWNFAATSADGNKMMAIGGIGEVGIWTLQTTPTPRLNIAPLDSNLKVSWLVPSENFVLRQSPDLSSWVDVSNAPVLNLTNLQEEIVLPPANSSGFYRLQSR
jgi:photosystem II stability/assembly factor-like uncharacterized protein